MSVAEKPVHTADTWREVSPSWVFNGAVHVHCRREAQEDRIACPWPRRAVPPQFQSLRPTVQRWRCAWVLILLCFFCYLSLRCQMRRPAELRSTPLPQPRQGQAKVRAALWKHVNLGDSCNQVLRTNAFTLMCSFKRNIQVSWRAIEFSPVLNEPSSSLTSAFFMLIRSHS